MALHTLAIAKASFAASLVRPDPTSIPRPEVAQFHDHFDALLTQCSSSKIQLCKDWLLKNITHSKTRTVALGKYFAATSSSLVKGPNVTDSRAREEDGPPLRRRQLHVLYLLNDLLHHVEFHADSPAAKVTLVESLPSSLLDILQSAAAHSLKAFPKHHARIQDLIDLWANQGFYPSIYIQKLRDTAENAAKAQNHAEKAAKPPNGVQDDSSQINRDAPYIMPPSHGDPSIPFYDLPAGNMMPLIIPNSTAPINPESMKPLQFMTGPADPKLAATIEDFLKSVDALDVAGLTENDNGGNDIDELGQAVLRDAISGEIMEGDCYYGWSRAFCEKMKNGGQIRGFGNEMTRDESRSRSASPQKRRRYSSSGSYGSVGERLSASRSRTRSPERQRLRSMSASRSRSPPTDPPFPRARPAYGQSPPPPLIQSQGPSPPPPPPFTQGFPLGPGGIPIPPRPAGYSGPWPPPPPPPLGPPGTPPFAFGPGNQGFPNRGGWEQQPLGPNQGGWAHQTPPPSQGHANPYGMPRQSQPPAPSFGNAHHNVGGSYGGWSR